MQLSITMRPRKFDDIYGQPAIVKGLKKRAITNNWPSAILIRGITGVGKSSLAQIIAMTINCKSPVQGNPCCQCSSCRSIMEERFDRNTKRLDGGSSSKDDVIDFSALAEMSPQYDKNNIFIIEEADQLSKAAQNSLLKLLEHPREKTYFILLSMVTNGIPEAIMNRCQVYKLNSFNITDTMFSLKDILEKNKLWNDPGIPQEFYLKGLTELSVISNGEFRYAVQLLEKCITEEIYTLEEIKNNLGVLSSSTIYEALDDLLSLKPSFFPKLYNLKIQEFYDKSYYSLSKALEYRITKEVDNEYFKAQTEALANSKYLIDVIKIYDELSIYPYLRQSLFISKLSQFYITKKTRILEE